MIDVTFPTQAMRWWLQQHEPLAALVGDQIRESHIEDEDSLRSAQYPMVILDLHGGALPWAASHAFDDMHVYVYSRKSKEDAASIYQHVFNRLHAQRVAPPGSTHVLMAYARGTPSDLSGWVDTARAYFIRVPWQVFHV